MTDEERKFMQCFCVGCTLVLVAVFLLVIVNSCGERNIKPPEIPTPLIGVEKSLAAFCYMPYLGSK